MWDIANGLRQWHAAGREYALASVIGVRGSAPRPVGAAMAVDSAGAVIGSLSGGCVEGAVYELCREVLRSGAPLRERFGYSGEDGFAVGLTCGGSLEVFVQPVRAAARVVFDAALRAQEAVTLVRDLATGAAMALGESWCVGAEFGAEVIAEARVALELGATGVRVVGCDPQLRTVFVESRVAPPRLLVFGAVDFAAAVVRIGKFLGYRVTVCDARAVFATAARFPEADEVVVDWPHRYLAATAVDARTVLCVLTHDPKFDVPLLEAALRLPVAYVGAMGSRRTHADRLLRLRAAGLSESELARLRSPIGLDLGGRTAEETAVAVAAEIVAVRRGGSGRSLSGVDIPIHHDPDVFRPSTRAS
ncbi:XdhC/CoxI family protein [Nocardia panacis]|uniref:XdhC/CoxI family protein n=1 Tax=Nocardia panacis TaxID=2340916 RepID=A0A3A4KKV7_9NOCA|nr:XdhC/CoxI family protein [Nocardia panacis]RJO73627.1 XdhC/CoxI family protein [Nocardia panacis]